MKRKILIVLLISNFVNSQIVNDTIEKPQKIDNNNNNNNEFTILTGINFWKNSLFIEAGIGKYVEKNKRNHPFYSYYFFSTEINTLTGKDFIIGPKIGVWASGGVAAMTIGANLIYYTDFQNTEFYFRPEIGMGLSRVKVVYGYNAKLRKMNF